MVWTDVVYVDRFFWARARAECLFEITGGIRDTRRLRVKRVDEQAHRTAVRQEHKRIPTLVEPGPEMKSASLHPEPRPGERGIHL